MGAFAAEVLEVHPELTEFLASAESAVAVPGFAAQDGPHAGEQFPHLEGLAQVVVAAGLESVDPVVLGILGGEKQNRRVVLGLADTLTNTEPIHARQHHVENHQIIFFRQDALQGFIPAGDPDAGQPLHLQIQLDALGQAQFVFHQQDVGAKVHVDLRDLGC